MQIKRRNDETVYVVNTLFIPVQNLGGGGGGEQLVEYLPLSPHLGSRGQSQ